MAKATHTGTCQWCGSRQKLPGGVLSVHGYDVKHGFFNGVCSGSGYRPYEISCDRIEKSIAYATAERQKLELQIWHLLENEQVATGNDDDMTVWIHQYKGSSRARGAVYLWTLTMLSRDAYDVLGYRVAGDGWKSLSRKSLKDVRAAGVTGYAAHLRRRADKLEEYEKHQQFRVDSWVPGEIQPIKG
jgi:hypothetical protein